jgi:acetolactate synthase-1/2/3 large subunit
MHAGAWAEARALAEKAALPCVMSLTGLGAVPSDHPLALGLLGMHGARYANLALEECDLLIAAGSRFGDRSTGQAAHFCTQAKIIHLDIDPSEINKIKTAALPVLGDLKASLAALLPRIQAGGRATWLARIQELKKAHPLYPDAEEGQAPAGWIRLAGRLLPENAIVATDVGQHQMWTAQNFPHRLPRAWLTSAGLGTMGFGLPAGLGAALAHPDRMVAIFTGDGSLLMNLQELATAAEENLNVKILLFDNQALGLVHQQQDLFFVGRFFASQFKTRSDFVQIAQGLGIRALTLDGAEDPVMLMEEAFATPGPFLIHKTVSVQHKVFPMVPPGAANRDMLGGPRPA